MATLSAASDDNTMPSRLGGIARGAAAIIAAAALIGVALQYSDFVLGKDTWAAIWSTIDFLSKFTIQINLLVALLTGAAALGRPDLVSRPGLAGAACLYAIIVAVTYALLLSAVYDPQGPILVAIILLHYAVPAGFAGFWLLFLPKGALGLRHLAVWLAYPAAYVAYSLLRGAFVGWYPYPFLDAAALGYATVMSTVASMIVGFSLVAVILIAIDRMAGRFTHGRALSSLLTRSGPNGIV